MFTRSEELFSASLAQRRFNLVVLGVFGGAALLLALAGVYGAIAFNVAQRTREIGVRLALGARRSSVVALVLRRSLVIAGIGVAAGAAVALGAAQLIDALLYGVPAHDPAVYAAAAIALLAAAAGAASIPAMRACRIDPLITLREE